MRYRDINDLLVYCKNSLVAIKQKYDESLKDRRVVTLLRIDIKNFMENLRSVLDYMARDIADVLAVPTEKKIYLPYGETQRDFLVAIRKYLPNLEDINPDIYSLIEGMQPHKCGNPWLYNLCWIVNKKKHDSLFPQNQISEVTFGVGLPGNQPAILAPAGAIVAPPNEISINDIPLAFDPKTGIPLQTPSLKVNLTKWVKYVFQGTNIEVYPLLETAFRNIKEASEKLYHILRSPAHR